MKTFLAICVIGAALRAEPLPDILARMDRAAVDFRSVSAKMKRVQFTAVLSESSEMDGVMRLRRNKKAVEGVVELREPNPSKPNPRTIFVSGNKVQVYYPNAKSVEIYDASKYTSNIDQLLTLGFGTTSAELSKSYQIKEGGTEKLGTVSTTRLELLPKSDELKKLITKIELWIPEGQSNPIREKITEPSGNYELVDYSETKINLPLPESSFQLKLPADVTKVQPQK